MALRLGRIEMALQEMAGQLSCLPLLASATQLSVIEDRLARIEAGMPRRPSEGGGFSRSRRGLPSYRSEGVECSPAHGAPSDASSAEVLRPAAAGGGRRWRAQWRARPLLGDGETHPPTRPLLSPAEVEPPEEALKNGPE